MPGELIGIYGASGIGKSSLLHLLAGIRRPDAGWLHYNEECWYDAQSRQFIRPQDRSAGLVFQDYALFPHFSVAQNIAYATSDRSVLQELLHVMELQDFAHQRPQVLSGGQRQRLALAASTIHDPPLLFLDEPTSAVDPQSRRDFWESLFALVDRGTTMLVSTHYMDEAERCHALAILDRGKLVAQGSPRDLMHAIDAHVVEIESEHLRDARAVLAGTPVVLSVAQLGTRLHALVDSAEEDPAARLERALGEANVSAIVELTRPSLEDVFVDATRQEKR